jgi:O-antigen/teichoic acid export membrane protein
MLLEVVKITAALLILYSYLPYIRGILKKETKPSISTWGLLSVFDLALCIAQVKKGYLDPSIVTATMGPVYISYLLYKQKAHASWELKDSICVGFGGIGISCWIITNDPIWGICFFLSTISAAFVPTMIRAWNNPERENFQSWILKLVGFGISVCCVLLTSPWRESIESKVKYLAQPVVCLILQVVMVAILMKPSRSKN